MICKDSISSTEIEGFKGAMEHGVQHYEITFVNLKSIPKALVEVLYHYRYQEPKHLVLYVSHQRLSKYLNALGFRNSILPQKNIKAHNHTIEYTPLKSITIGGSADSLEKIVEIVQHIPFANITIFLIQHIKEDAKHLLDKILQEKTKYQVLYPKNGEKIQSGKIYIAPPALHMRIQDDSILLDDSEKVNYARPSLSILFDSIAKAYGSQNITVLTCGYGNDGSDALHTLRQSGASVILSDPKECEAKDMILNAMATNEYNYLFTINEIRSFFNTLLQTVVDRESLIKQFLKELNDVYGYDFTKYDPQSVMRRTESLMIKMGISSLPILIKEVLTRKSLFDELLLSISINVTQFFRKPTLYRAMRELIELQLQPSHLKIWVAGSSTGEEPYSIAMLLDNLGIYQHSLIYATDFNPLVIHEAKNALYSKESIEKSIENSKIGLKHGSILDYNISNQAYYEIKKYLKQNVLFFTHNLVTDGSFNQFDIISCKNVLIYFTPPLQESVLQLFYDSLYEEGFLLLGESESMHPNFSKKFKPYSIENRIYQKVQS